MEYHRHQLLIIANGFPQTITDGRSTQTTLTYDSYGNLYTTKVGSHPVVKTAHDLNINYQKRHGKAWAWGQACLWSVPSEGWRILTGESPVMVKARAM